MSYVDQHQDAQSRFIDKFGGATLFEIDDPRSGIKILNAEKILDFIYTTIRELYLCGTNVSNESTNRVVLIGIAGYAGSGKDAAVEALKYLVGSSVTSMQDPVVTLRSVQVIPFAQTLKAIAAMFFDEKQLVDRELKEKTDPFWGISPRHFLQMAGTEMFRRIWREDVWTKCFERKFLNIRKSAALDESNHLLDVVIVPDTRFHNEVECIKNLGGWVVRVKRPNNPLAIDHSHASEKDIPDLKVDFEAENVSKDAVSWSVDFWNMMTLGMQVMKGVR